MATPEFILKLREQIGHETLWLPGVVEHHSRDAGQPEGLVSDFLAQFQNEFRGGHAVSA